MGFDAAATIRGLQDLRVAILAAAKQSLGQAASYAAKQARSTTTFKDRTGRLRASIGRIDQSMWRYTVRAGVPRARYALFVEDGTRAHEIRPKKPGGVLRFVVGGEVRFARKVNHPGTKPTYFMRDARDAAEHALARFVEAGVARAIH